MTGIEAMGGGVFIAIMVFLALLAILWFLLPFAVFGTKPLLQEILKTQKAILAQLNESNTRLRQIKEAGDYDKTRPKTSDDMSPSERFLNGPER